MSNEVGNHLYKLTIKKIQALCTNYATKILADYVVDKSTSTQIYNVTDIVLAASQRKSDLRVGEDLGKWVWEVSGFTMEQVEPAIIKLNTDYTLFTDHIFAYAKTLNNLHYVFLIHRLDDDRAVIFFGFVENLEKFTIFQTIPVEIHENHLILDIKHLLNATAEFDVTRKQFTRTLEIMKSVFIGYTSNIFALFRDIADQNRRTYRCYVDEEDNKKATYYRKKLGDRKSIKVLDKPIILVLRDNDEIEQKINEHKSKRGNIRYAFSWIVRGHYRRLHDPESFGKDRNGDRVIQGMTWVETYLKGDENLPLLKRETIVIDKRKRA